MTAKEKIVIDINGKKMKEIITKDTQICDDFIEGWDNWDNTIIGSFGGVTVVGIVNSNTVLHDANYVFVLRKTKLRAIFHVYDLMEVSINEQRGLITAVGHETSHEYWLDNGEYHCNRNR